MPIELGKMNTQKLKISVLIPVYNEAETIGYCIEEAQKAIKKSNYNADIVIVDNNSEDTSVEIAKSYGVRILRNIVRGYGANLDYGIKNCKSDVVFFADADGSYSFKEFNNFMNILFDKEKKVDFVLGNRFSKNMEKNAMPLLNKYLGTPILTFFINFLYNANIQDCNCGMRAIRVNSYKKLLLQSPGMEYASEMIIKSLKKNLVIENHKFDFKKDLRSKAPHLDRWIDGWRHLRYILCSTDKTIVIKILAFFSLSFLILSITAPLSSIFLGDFPFHTSFIFLLLYVLSNTIFITFLTTRTVLHVSNDVYCSIINKILILEKQNKLIVISFYLFIFALSLMFYIIYKWAMNDYNKIIEYHSLVWMSVAGITASFVFYLDVVISNFKNFFRFNVK